jgi:hypothetical protein
VPTEGTESGGRNPLANSARSKNHMPHDKSFANFPLPVVVALLILFSHQWDTFGNSKSRQIASVPSLIPLSLEVRVPSIREQEGRYLELSFTLVRLYLLEYALSA